MASKDPTVAHGYIHQEDAYLRRLRRIEGQARGLKRMVEKDEYCIDIPHAGLGDDDRAEVGLARALEENLSHCVVAAAAAGGDEADAKVREATNAIARLVRS